MGRNGFFYKIIAVIVLPLLTQAWLKQIIKTARDWWLINQVHLISSTYGLPFLQSSVLLK